MIPSASMFVQVLQVFQFAIQQPIPCFGKISGKHILDGFKPFAIPRLIMSNFVLIGPPRTYFSSWRSSFTGVNESFASVEAWSLWDKHRILHFQFSMVRFRYFLARLSWFGFYQNQAVWKQQCFHSKQMMLQSNDYQWLFQNIQSVFWFQLDPTFVEKVGQCKALGDIKL